MSEANKIMYQRIFYIFSTILILASITVLGIFGLPLGIDFKGGSLMELKFIGGADAEEKILSRIDIEEALSEFDLGVINVQRVEDDIVILRFGDVTEETHIAILEKLESVSELEIREERFDSIGPVIGAETMNKSIKAIIFVLVMIVAYVAWAFRGVSYPVHSWRYGVTALITLFHDVIITLGAAAVYLYFTGGEVGVPFVAAILTILGYSVNDTIVVFDRLRENLLRFGSKFSFTEAVNRSVNQSLVRSLNTSLTTLAVLFSIFIFGGATIQSFVAVLIFGIIVGTYSSLAVAAPLLATWLSVSKKGD